MRRFLQSPSFQVQSALIGQLTEYIVIGRTPQARIGIVTVLTIIASFSFQVSFISSSPKGEVVTLWWCSYVFAVHKPRLRLFLTGCILRCDVTLFPSHTHTHTHTHSHTTHYVQNAAFEQSIANTWTNNKTYLKSLIQKRQIAKLNWPFFFLNRLCAQPALYSHRFMKLLFIKCVAQIWTFGLCCCVVNKS